jgi:hypothetical protein
MRCIKCLCLLAVCACLAVGSFVTITSDVVDCRGLPNIQSGTWSWCELPPMDMPHDEPGQMPGRPLPDVTVAVSTSSSTSVHSGVFTWPSTST